MTSGSQQRAGRSLVKLLIAVVVVLAAGTVHARAVGASVRDVPRALDASAHHGHGFEPSLAELAAKPKFKDGSAVAAEAGKFPKDRDLIGTVRTWVVNDKFFGVDFFKDFALRGVGKTVEVWVASGDDGVSRGLEFPAGDCRNGTLTRVTDEQIDYLMHEFDQTIRPRQAEVFGDPLARDGSNALLPRWFPSIPADAYRGDGRRTVVLVDNIRDAEFYGPGSGQVQGYIAPRFMEYFDRNVLVLTGVNWDHRLGKRPLETLDAPDPCVRRRAWPLHIEAVLAHEFHHVRFFDEVLRDGADTTWRNEHWVFEGMAEWQLSRTPYIDSRSRDVLRNLFLNCFLGWTALTGSFACPGTPEDSLTIWGDDSPGDGWALDYGAASSFMHFLHGRYGDRFMAALLGRQPPRRPAERAGRDRRRGARR